MQNENNFLLRNEFVEFLYVMTPLKTPEANRNILFISDIMHTFLRESSYVFVQFRNKSLLIILEHSSQNQLEELLRLVNASKGL